MFREMRRKEKQLSTEESIEILKNGEFGTMSTISIDGYPYITPLNYVYYNNSIYFHSAKNGHKIDNILKCNKVSFCVTTDIEILTEKVDTNYKSVVLFGTAKKVIEQEKRDALLKLIKKHSNQFVEVGKGYIEKSKDKTIVIKIYIEHITGKAQKSK